MRVLNAMASSIVVPALRRTPARSRRSTTTDYDLDGLPRRVVSDNRVTAYAYTGAGARTALGEGPLGGSLDMTRYAVNDAGVAESMPSGDPGTIAWEYNPLGQLTTETRGARTQTWTYRTDDLLERTVVRTSGADIASFAYDYDELGRQTEQACAATRRPGSA